MSAEEKDYVILSGGVPQRISDGVWLFDTDEIDELDIDSLEEHVAMATHFGLYELSMRYQKSFILRTMEEIADYLSLHTSDDDTGTTPRLLQASLDSAINMYKKANGNH